ncbi:hypothetical protein PENCOP_c005G01310 [Penicillium coprophilum]|uniref:Uncharacterized protein n=1 Tax=Penicillium coprophilum TaxID=36646 RepID=A0A1V6UR50_9EURO|nr:hypothetical protein PENCOP_c005G01310 [Penicillium coprophilum]
MGFAPLATLPAPTNELYYKLKAHRTWGFVIYRTTYSPHSDVHFSTVVKYLEACIKRSFFGECEWNKKLSRGVNNDLYEEIWAQHSSTIMEDAAQFEDASLDKIRAHFEAWVDAQGQRDKFNKYRMCMIIDEECLQTLLGTSAEALEQDTDNERYKTVRYVKVLEAWPEIDQYDTFPGWMKCCSLLLWDLWLMMCDLDEMRMSWERIDAEDDGVYCG